MSRDRLQGRKTLNVAGFLDEFEKDDIKRNIDIVNLFESFGVKLSKKGKSYLGRCPWHDDDNPSLSVDRAKGLYNCFGCGESGDAFTLVEKMKGYTFREAVEYLKKSPRISSADENKFRGEEPEKVELIESLPKAISLSAIADYYHKRLFENERAVEYLRKRGLKNHELYSRFNIGFADGSILEKTSEGQKKELTELGVLRTNSSAKDGNGSGAHYVEHFQNCVTFPITDDAGDVVGMYGRSVDESDSFKHRYLKGKHRGVFNRKASKVYDEIILTESIIDCLSLVELGFENTQSIYGTNGFTDGHLRILKDDRVKTIILAFDNDEAGKKAGESLKERLLSDGFGVKIIIPPPSGLRPSEGGENVAGESKDWNEYLVSGGSAETIKSGIGQAETFRPAEAEEKYFSIKHDKLSYTFTVNDRAYRITGVKEMFIGSLRVNIKAESDGEKYYDNLDLYSARSRTAYSQNLSGIFGVDPKRIENELIIILEYLEAERDKSLLTGAVRKEEELTREEIDLGMSFLKSPDILEEIASDMETLGYVGEDLNKKLLYLSASSRILDDPISVIILSQSSAGKSMLVDTVRKLMPPEDVIAVTSLSDQALNYVSDMTHKFLILGEAVHSEIIEHQIREMLSGKELSRLVTMKDEKSGRMTSKEIRTPAIVSAVMSGTKHNINPENASRCFIVNSDESREQTKRIHEKQRLKHSLKRYYEKTETIPEIIKKHRAAQKLLKKVVIINPFAEQLNFPDAVMRTRRDHDRFLDLIACICFIRQYQKEIKQDGAVAYIECDADDYRAAYGIMVDGVLSATMAEMPKGALEFYETIRKMCRELGKRDSLKPEDVSFTGRDVREYTGFGHTWVKQNLRILLEREYLGLARGGAERSRAFYRLRSDEPVKRLDLSMIPAPADMEKIIEKRKSGRSGH